MRLLKMMILPLVISTIITGMTIKSTMCYGKSTCPRFTEGKIYEGWEVYPATQLYKFKYKIPEFQIDDQAPESRKDLRHISKVALLIYSLFGING